MMEARAGELRIGKAARMLFDESSDAPTPAAELSEMGRFEEGQLCGPCGPQFVGFGDVPPMRRALAERPSIWLAAGTATFVAATLARLMFGN